jgi:hypothetical protein
MFRFVGLVVPFCLSVALAMAGVGACRPAPVV